MAAPMSALPSGPTEENPGSAVTSDEVRPEGFARWKEALSKTNSPEHDKLLSYAKNLVEISRREMVKHYHRWDEHDMVFRQRRFRDKEDRAAYDKDAPEKLIVPLTFSQVMTYVSFATATLTQNSRPFELEPTGTEASPLKESLEKILQRDTKKNAWNAFLVQFFLDQARFGIGCAEVCWTEEFQNIRVPRQQTQDAAFGISQTTETNAFIQIPKFVGNKIYPISPYRFFPDTRVPLTRFQDGEFCASEDMFSISVLQRDQINLMNLDKIPKMTEKEYNDRHSQSRIEQLSNIRLNPNMASGSDQPSDDSDAMVKSGSVIVTKVVCDIKPKDFKTQIGREEGEALGDEDFPVRYIIWYANDATIIRFEEATYLHGQFPYVAAQLTPDQHMTINQGLAETCSHINTLVTWLINAHTASQKNAYESKFVVDPSGIDIKTLESRSPYIFMKRNASGTDVRRYIQQFQVQDTTQNAMQDVAALKGILEDSTGMSSILQGNYSEGRRDATQSRVVARSAATRGTTSLAATWDCAFTPLARQLIANNRQEMSFEMFAAIIGPQNDPTKPDIETLYAMFAADPLVIAMAEDFFVFDGSTPSEKAFLSQSLQEIFMAVVSNPEIMQVLGYGPEQLRMLFEEMYELRGVTAPYLPPPAPTQPPVAQPPVGPQPGAVPSTGVPPGVLPSVPAPTPA